MLQALLKIGPQAFKRKKEGRDLAFQSVARILRSIPRVSDQLARPLGEAGNLLTGLTDASDGLIRESECLLTLATGQQGGQAVVNDTMELLRGPLDYLGCWRSEMAAREEALRICADVLSRMLLSEQKLQATVAPLRHTQTMFRIEAAGLQEETRQVFTGLTEKIESVHHRVQDTFAQQFRIVAENHVVVREVLQAVRSENARLQEMINAHRTDIESSLGKLDVKIRAT